MDLGQLAQLTRDTGIAPGYLRGIESGTNLAQTVANTDKARAELSRYQAETPTYLQQKQQELEKARLGNLQGQADETAGVYGAKAQESVATSKQKALEAQQAWERLPEEHKTKMLTAVKNKNMEMLDSLETMLAQTSDVPGTIAWLEQQYPEVTKDSTWASLRQQYSKMPAQQALNFIKSTKAKLASSDFYGSAEGQGRMILEDQQQGNRMELERLRGQQGLQEAQTRADSTSANSKMNKYEALQYWGDMARNAKTQEEYDYANAQFKAIQGEQMPTGTNFVTGEPEGAKPKVEAPRPAHLKPKDNPAAIYLKGATSKEDFARRVKALRDKGWTKAQIEAANQ